MSVTLESWIYVSLIALLASIAGCRIVRWLPWNDSAKNAYLDRFSGLALAPLLLGLSAVLALGFFPQASHATHVVVIIGLLVLLAAVGGLSKNALSTIHKPSRFSLAEMTCMALLALVIVGLFVNALILPLTQNDALEYATVGRELYLARTLDAYPLLNPETNASGFYGPWTHPPLYVALIYAMHLMQGNADSPTLMQLIAPWCALVATGVVFALGSLVSRRAAILASLVFLLTPLFFLGADSGLIDALPVLGSTLMMAVLLGLTGRSFVVGAAQGIVIGLALWTHSQAILLIPLVIAGVVLLHGLKHWQVTLPQITALLVVALVVAAWPYLRNLLIFDTLISDTPKVFAFEALNWKDYFAYNRGIVTPVAKIQYGLFKGLFAMEAYSVTFWLMLCGLIYYFCRILNLRSIWRVWMDGKNIPQPIVIYCAGFLICVYLAGVLVSIIGGTDLMIRNERYMLMILPMAALISGWLLDRVLQDATLRKRGVIRAVLVYTMVISITLFSVQFLVLILYQLSVNRVAWQDLTELNDSILMRQTEYGSMKYLREHTPADALVLSMRPSDMYYSHRRMISYLDVRMLPFYQEKDPVKAWKILKDMGVQYVQVPDYFLPPVYNSTLMEILARPDLSSLEYNNIRRDTFSRGRLYRKDLVMGSLRTNQFNHLYTLKPEKRLTVGEHIDFSPSKLTWIQFNSWVIGGRKPFFNIINSIHDLKSSTSRLDLPLNLFQRERISTLAVGGSKTLNKELPPTDLIPVKENKQYVVDMLLNGRGNITFWIIQYDSNGQALRYSRRNLEGEKISIGDMVLSETQPEKRFMRRMTTLPEAKYLQVGLIHAGQSWVEVKRAELVTLDAK